MRKLRGDTLMDICNVFGLKKDSSAGSIVDRVKKQVKTDKKLKMKISKIEQNIIMS
jgi:uridine phosphorylase